MDRLRALRPNSAPPNERTPLLPGSSRPPRDVPPTSTEGLPHIGSFVAEMRPEDLHKYSLDNLYPPALHSRPEQTAFSISALLYYRSYLRGSSTRGRDIWVQWKQEEQNQAASKEVETLLEQVWSLFLAEEGSSEELQDVLWTAYPLYPDSRKTVRVLDFLASGEAPQQFLVHPLIQLCLAEAWIYGQHDSHEDESSALSRLFHFIDGTGAPHVLHIIDMLVYLAYLFILGSYSLHPLLGMELPRTDLRSYPLLIYSFSRLFRSWSGYIWPFVVVFLSFLASYPSFPLPNSSAYAALLVAFAGHVVLLHTPVHPGPLFLLPPDQILPLAVLVWRGLSRLFVPVVAFFIPGLVLSLLLLATSLQQPFSLTSLNAVSPMEARSVFFTLFIVLFLFLCCALAFSVLVQPFISSTESTAPWDRYSKSVGLEARQAFVGVVATYAGPYHFPAPLNLPHVLLVQVPRGIRVLAGCGTPSNNLIDLVERVLWRVIVAPLTFVVAAFWLWHLPRRW